VQPPAVVAHTPSVPSAVVLTTNVAARSGATGTRSHPNASAATRDPRRDRFRATSPDASERRPVRCVDRAVRSASMRPDTIVKKEDSCEVSPPVHVDLAAGSGDYTARYTAV
jgi:hypothetical protein